MSEAVVEEAASTTQALRVLARSGRRLIEHGDGWVVVAGADRRRRAQAQLCGEQGRRLVETGVVRAAPGGGYVLDADIGGRPCEADLGAATLARGPGVFVAAGRARVQERAGGAGFARLAARARTGDGPVSVRQVLAGLRLITDAETAMRDVKLTMNWDAVASDRVARSPGRGGMAPAALSAERRLRRIRLHMRPAAFAIAWSACVDGRSLAGLARLYGINTRQAARRLSDALEKLAEAYAS